MRNALDDMVVLDLTSYIAGPYGATLLGDQGADVIKVEAPSGDMMRRYPSSLEGANRTFLGTNRNKRSIRLDLKSEDGLAAFHRMVIGADVVVHNLRAGKAAALGVDYETLHRLRPDLVYCSLSGYGESLGGPMVGHPGYDQMLQCFTGMATAQGESLGVPQVLRGSIVDYFAAALLAQGITAALVHRLRTGEGQHLRVSLLRAALALQSGRFIWAEGEPIDISREPDSSRFSGPMRTLDGYLYFQANTPKFWVALCEAIGLPQLALDERYDTIVKRAAVSEVLMPQIAKAFMQRTAFDWERAMTGRVPVVALRTIGEMFEHPQVLAEGLLAEHEHPDVGAYRALNSAVDMGTGKFAAVRAPLAGEHTEEVLTGLGFDESEIRRLRSVGAVS